MDYSFESAFLPNHKKLKKMKSEFGSNTLICTYCLLFTVKDQSLYYSDLNIQMRIFVVPIECLQIYSLEIHVHAMS